MHGRMQPLFSADLQLIKFDHVYKPKNLLLVLFQRTFKQILYF